MAGDDVSLVGRAHVSYPGPTDDGPGVELTSVTARLVVRAASPQGRPVGPALVDRPLDRRGFSFEDASARGFGHDANNTAVAYGLISSSPEFTGAADV